MAGVVFYERPGESFGGGEGPPEFSICIRATNFSICIRHRIFQYVYVRQISSPT